MDLFPTPLKANAPAQSETRMSQEACREIADGACRDEDVKAYRRSQARFAPAESDGVFLLAYADNPVHDLRIISVRPAPKRAHL